MCRHEGGRLLRGRVIVDLEGTEVSASERDLLLHPEVAGVIFFTRNFVTVEQIQALISDIRFIRPELILCVDQEGGRVQRFKEPLTRLPAVECLRSLYKVEPAKACQASEKLGYLMASEMLALGVDVSFAPVLDIDYGRNSVIGDRAFGCTAEEIVVLAGAYIAGMKRAGMAVTGKHFPGHGYVTLDSHIELPHDERAMECLEQQDLRPFQELCQQLDAIMSAHIIYDQADPYAATFSAYWLQCILRQNLCFEGLVFSDDLNMQAAHIAGSMRDRAVKALEAGCDLLIVCNNRMSSLEVLAALESRSLTVRKSLASLRRAALPDWSGFADSDERLETVEWIKSALPLR